MALNSGANEHFLNKISKNFREFSIGKSIKIYQPGNVNIVKKNTEKYFVLWKT
jgi:hypothetical protein